MSLDYPTFDELSSQIQAEFSVQLPSIDPTVFGTWAISLANGNAVLTQTILLVLRDLEKQLFPQTATDEFLDLWGGYEDLERKEPSPSTGFHSVTGVVGTVIPTLTDFTGSNGISYKSTVVSTIIAINQVIVTLTRSGTTVTASLAADHQLATGIEVAVSGATEPEYNGSFIVTVTDRDKFQYQATGSPSTPATGSPVYDVDLASVSVEAQSTGLGTNLSSGAQLSFTSAPPAGADGTGIVQFDGLTGGSSQETNDEYRVRILLSRSIREGVFTPDQIKLAALGVAGNTRAFVKKPTLSVCSGPSPGDELNPVPGQVSVFVLRDNDPSIVPSAGIRATTKTAIIENGRLPGNTSEIDVFVPETTLVETDFDFSSIDPDTPTMRTAVTDQLNAFFEDTVDFEKTVTEASYLGAIQNTQDLQTGAFLESFSLTAPTGDIVVSSGEIASLGEVTFA